MNILSWIIFGLMVGVIANILDPRPARGGLVAAMGLGIVGGMVGGFVGSLLFGVGVTGFNISSLIVAILGALLMLGVGRVLQQRA